MQLRQTVIIRCDMRSVSESNKSWRRDAVGGQLLGASLLLSLRAFRTPLRRSISLPNRPLCSLLLLFIQIMSRFFVGEVRGSGAVNNLPAHVKSPGLISGGLIGLVAGINLLSKIKKKTAITYSSRARKIIQHGRRNGLMEEFGTYGDVIWRTLP
jgi:hypothetical protein